MAAVIKKNQATASLRQVDLIVNANGYGPAPVETDFVALGILFVSDGSNVPHYKLGTGTCVNKRIPLTIADDVVESVDTGADTLTLTAHLYKNLDGPLFSDEAMGSIAIGDPFWVIRVDDNTIAVAGTFEDAQAGTHEPLTGTETGATIRDDSATPSTTERGLPGKFTYTFTQAETSVDLPELSVLIEGDGFANAEGGGGYSTANMNPAIVGFETTAADGVTNQEMLNVIYRTAFANFTKSGNHYVYEKGDGSGDSHEADVTAGGRSGANLIDPD